MKPLILPVFCSILLTACSHFDTRLCQDSQALGLMDGKNGAPLRLVQEQRQEECGPALQVTVYQQGHAQGITHYCTPGQGKWDGERGIIYRQNCPAELEPAYLKGYRPAILYYQLVHKTPEIADIK